MSSSDADYTVQRDSVAMYFYWLHIAFMLAVMIWFFGLGLVLAIVYAFTIGTWLPRKQAAALKYWLYGPTLRVDQGVYFLKRKAIPLDRVTDIALVQGPLMRWCDIWALQVQTASMSGNTVPEATMYGIENPEEIRDQLLKARNAAAAARTA